MPICKRSVCRFYQSMVNDQYFDFAAMAANSQQLALVGVNLSIYGLSCSSPLFNAVYTNTIDHTSHGIEYEFLNAIPGETCMDILAKISVPQYDSTQYLRIENLETDDDPVKVAFDMFHQIASREKFWPTSVAVAVASDTKEERKEYAWPYTRRYALNQCVIRVFS